MAARPESPLFDLWLQPGFLTPAECASLAAEMRAAAHQPATVHGRGQGGTVDAQARQVLRVLPSAATEAWVHGRLAALRAPLAARFGRALAGCEAPQFLRYREGDFFVAHQDGNTGLLQGARDAERLVSVVVLLDPPGAHAGGELVFSEWRADRRRGREALPAAPGLLVAFPAETTHEVTPVTAGERLSIACWFG